MTRRVGILSALFLVAAVLTTAAWFVTGAGGPAPATAPATARMTAAAAADAPYALVVDLSDRTLYVLENGQVARTYPVAVGSPNHPTPRGTYTIRHIVWNPRWVPPDAKWARNKTAKAPGAKDNPVGKVKMFFAEPDYYIHGTRDYDSLGEAESHGCVRMANGSAVALAQDVMAHGGKPVPESWVQSVLDRFRSSRQVYLSRPIPVTVRG